MQHGIKKPEGTTLNFKISIKRFIFKRGLSGLYIQGSRRGIHPSRLEDVIRLPDRQGNHLHVIQRETADIDLSALRVRNRYSIVTDGGMLRS